MDPRPTREGPLGGHNPPGRAPLSWRAQGEGALPHPRRQGVGPLTLILSAVFFIFSKWYLCGFSGHSEKFYSTQKQHHGSSVENSASPWLVSFKSCKLESKTRGKALGKVDTLEMYHALLKLAL